MDGFHCYPLMDSNSIHRSSQQRNGSGQRCICTRINLFEVAAAIGAADAAAEATAAAAAPAALAAGETKATEPGASTLWNSM